MNIKSKVFSVHDEDFKTSSWTTGHHWCVQVARKSEGVAVRDSKDPGKTTLFFTGNEWEAFIKGVKGGEFDIET